MGKSGAIKLKDLQKNPWTPKRCEICKHAFNPNKWTWDYSMSGELTWTCPRCAKENYPPMGN